jgi:glyoxylase-like metal-dependent hydrolase (beta-lactamase superfamily II)
MEVLPGVHAIETLPFGRAYLYQEADRLTLIDTSQPGNAELILSAIESIGGRPEDLRQIIVTHWHVDHAGSLADVAERTGAQVLVHALDAPVVRGERAGAGPRGVWRPLGPLFRRAGPKQRGARVDRELQDGDEIDLDGGARIVYVPGHTAGSIAVYVPARRLLFTGDAAANAFGLKPTIGIFTEDARQARASFRKLAQLDFEVACFGHGAPLDRDASRAFRRLEEKLSD